MGATYTRQSSFTDGDVISAADSNDEFDQLLAAFQASSGHTHDGTANEGGPITKLLGTSLTIGDGSSGTDIAVTFDGESNDGVLTWMEDEDYFKFSDDILIIDNEQLIFGSDSNVAISYDETTTDSLKIAATEGAGLAITLMADEGDDAGDEWKLNIADGGTLTLGNDIASAGSYVTHLTLTPNSTVASSTLAVAGNLTVGGSLTLGSGAELAEAELEMLDGITAGTVAASKAMVVDANRDIGTVRNLTIDGTFSDGNYTFDTSGNVSGLGTVASGAITSSGIIKTDNATDATSTLDGSLQTDGGLSVAKDAILGNDVKLLSDSAVLSLGLGSDATFTHDGTTGLTIAATPISIDSTGELHLNSTTGDIKLQGGGTDQIAFDLDGTAGEVIMKPAVDSDDLVISQYDGTEVIRVEDNGSLGLVGNKLSIANSSSDVVIKPLTDAKDIIFQQYDGTVVATVEDDGTFNVPTGKLAINSTAITSTAAELNLLDTASANSVVNSKAVIYGSSGELAGTLSTAAQANITSVGTLTALTVDEVAVDGKVITMTGSSGDTFTTTVGTNGATSLVTVDTAGAAAHLEITADGTVDINSAGVLTLDSGAAINIEPASGSAILLDGTISIDAGVVTGATSITSTAFVGDITGDVTGTADVATVATTVTITDNESTNEDNAIIFTAGGDVDGGNIGLESDGTLTYNPSTGKVTATGFIGALTGAVTGNVAGNLTGTVATATQNSITTATGLVSVGALDSGSITSGFGTIDTGSSAITTTGVGSFGSLDISGAIDVDGTTNLDVVDIDGALTQDGGAVFNEDSADVDFRVESNGQTHKLFVDGGNDVVCLGLATPETIGGQMPGLQIEGTDYKGGQVSIWRNADDDAGAYLLLGKSRGTSLNSDTIVQDGDDVGIINFIGADGGDRAHPVASIRAAVDGTPGSNDMPGRIEFWTTADGGTTMTERMRIKNDGDVIINSSTGIGGVTPTNLFTVSGSVNSYVSRFNNTVGSGNVFMHLWRFTQAPDNNTSTFLYCDDGNGSTNRLRIDSDGDVKNHDNSYGAISDERIKQDITDANSQWDDIKAVKVRNFKKKDDVRQYGDKAWSQIGVIAQELETVSPKLIRENSVSVGDIESSSEFGTLEDDLENPVYYVDGDTIPSGKKVGDFKKYIKKVKEQKTTVKSVNYSILYMKAVKALQEAMTRIETLESKVKALEDA